MYFLGNDCSIAHNIILFFTVSVQHHMTSYKSYNVSANGMNSPSATELLWRPDWSRPPQTSSFPAAPGAGHERWSRSQTSVGLHTAPVTQTDKEIPMITHTFTRVQLQDRRAVFVLCN